MSFYAGRLAFLNRDKVDLFIFKLLFDMTLNSVAFSFRFIVYINQIEQHMVNVML